MSRMTDYMFGLALFRHSLRVGRRLFVDVYNYLLTDLLKLTWTNKTRQLRRRQFPVHVIQWVKTNIRTAVGISVDTYSSDI